MAFKKSGKTNANEISYKVLEECGSLGTNANGWEMKLRFISWNGKEPKYDLRSWKEDETGEKCSKGITLTGEELEALYGVLSKLANSDN